MARKVKTFVVKLVSMAGTGFFYTTKRNMRSQKPKLLVRKYDPVIRLHTLFRVRIIHILFSSPFYIIISLNACLNLPAKRCGKFSILYFDIFSLPAHNFSVIPIQKRLEIISYVC
jgi:large subunit ribosomal protein L33